jgi:hypothetical protein
MPRLSVDISDDLSKRLRSMPWGIRKHVIIALLDKAVQLYENHGEKGMGALLSSEFSLVFHVARNGQNLAGTKRGKKDG